MGLGALASAFHRKLLSHRVESRDHSFSGGKNVKGYKTTYESSPLLKPTKVDAESCVLGTTTECFFMLGFLNGPIMLEVIYLHLEGVVLNC